MNHAKGRVARGRGKELINKQAACRISNVVVGASYTQLPSLGHFGSIRECLLELEASFDVPAAQVMSIILKDLELQVCDDRRDLCACHDGAEYALKVTAPTNHQRRWQSHSYVSTPNPLDSRVVPSIVRSTIAAHRATPPVGNIPRGLARLPWVHTRERAQSRMLGPPEQGRIFAEGQGQLQHFVSPLGARHRWPQAQAASHKRWCRHASTDRRPFCASSTPEKADRGQTGPHALRWRSHCPRRP
eukprot:scaffold60163_cov28-Tisochrysis_lutea.AAC.2